MVFIMVVCDRVLLFLGGDVGLMLLLWLVLDESVGVGVDVGGEIGFIIVFG